MRTVRRISLVFLATVALAACSRGSDGSNDVPSGWIRSQYGGNSSAGYVDRRDATSTVAKEITGHSSAKGRTSKGDMVFLRYRNDIVAITPYQGGSRIEIDDYRTGYHRWKPHLRSVWPHPDSDAFRGGGPGTGK
ncbi:DUF4247 domain-containing protein [Streptomyces fulvorobeus]|uniref:Lipoprotein n=1 Tax=Streptomyces fulvorobeus TaxID=284028 RepID=A0A7J0BYN3_9ACTN|nr:DUF4247 domain-containing protein [Streptomyces fulvorobeus]NYE39131.1 hypothetical protein [Streptomyces fulvorobeus]GFM95331.1 lipoprotein [Streptomyces fulvorobeus]